MINGSSEATLYHYVVPARVPGTRQITLPDGMPERSLSVLPYGTRHACLLARILSSFVTCNTIIDPAQYWGTFHPRPRFRFLGVHSLDVKEAAEQL